MQKTVMLFVIAWVLWTMPANAQYLNSTAFCRDVVNNECVGPIPNGESVAISSLSTVNGYKALYFWGNIRNPLGDQVAVFYAREGECYKGDVVKVMDRQRRDVSLGMNAFQYFNSLDFPFLLQSLGLDEVNIDVYGIKIRIVKPESSYKYRVHDYRYAICPGTFSARVMTMSNEPAAGNNPLYQVHLY